jgi:hypothetical protein
MSTITSTFLIAFLNVTLEKINNSPLCILNMLMSQIIPLLTRMLGCMWIKSPPLGSFTMSRIDPTGKGGVCCVRKSKWHWETENINGQLEGGRQVLNQGKLIHYV